MSLEDEDTQPNRPAFISWDPNRLKWADVNGWVKLGDVDAYAKACDAKLVGVKIAEGMRWKGVDTAKLVVEMCLDAGLTVVGYQYGPYHPEAFLEAFPAREGCVPCLDFEFHQTNQDDWVLRIQRAEEWVTKVADAHKVFPWFYSRSEWVAAGQPANTMIKYCPYWGPQYGPRLALPRGVGHPVAWQYSDGVSGSVPRTHAGIAGNKPCDMNVLLVDPGALKAYWMSDELRAGLKLPGAPVGPEGP